MKQTAANFLPDVGWKCLSWIWRRPSISSCWRAIPRSVPFTHLVGVIGARLRALIWCDRCPYERVMAKPAEIIRVSDLQPSLVLNRQVFCCGLFFEGDIDCHAAQTRGASSIAWVLLENGGQARKPPLGQRIAEARKS